MAKQAKKRLNRIAEIMEERKLTQENLAEDAGMTQRSISLYKNGIREPSLETLAKLARVLKLPGRDFINF